METSVLAKFLKHLTSCTEAVLQKEELELYDILSLRRELAELKRHIDGKEKIDPVILGRILDLEIRVDDGLLTDSKKSRWFSVLRLLFHRSPLLALERSRRLEKVKQQLSVFRDDLSHLKFLVKE